ARATTHSCPLPLHDALPILAIGFGAHTNRSGPYRSSIVAAANSASAASLTVTGYPASWCTSPVRPCADVMPLTSSRRPSRARVRSEEHTPELQSLTNLACRL